MAVTSYTPPEDWLLLELARRSLRVRSPSGDERPAQATVTDGRIELPHGGEGAVVLASLRIAGHPWRTRWGLRAADAKDGARLSETTALVAPSPQRLVLVPEVDRPFAAAEPVPGASPVELHDAAFGKHTRQSSAAELCGEDMRPWMVPTEPEAAPFWEVDLGEASFVESLSFWLAPPALAGAELRVSTFAYHTPRGEPPAAAGTTALCTDALERDAAGACRLHLEPRAVARYVRVALVAPGAGAVSLALHGAEILATKLSAESLLATWLRVFTLFRDRPLFALRERRGSTLGDFVWGTTYGDVWQRACAFAGGLAKLRGPRSPDEPGRIAICTRNRLEAVVADLAAVQRGQAVVALSPDEPEARLADILERARIDCALVEPSQVAAMRRIARGRGSRLRWLVVCDEGAAAGAALGAGGIELETISGDSLACARTTATDVDTIRRASLARAATSAISGDSLACAGTSATSGDSLACAGTSATDVDTMRRASLARATTDIEAGRSHLSAEDATAAESIGFDALCAHGADTADAPELRPAAPTAPYSLLFTSGSTGTPKGAVRSYAAFNAFLRAYGAPQPAVHLSFQPLCHLSERVTLPTVIMLGGRVAFSSGGARLLEELALLRPTFVFSVPRLYESLHARYQRRLAAALVDVRGEDERAQVEARVLAAERSAFGGRLQSVSVGSAPCSPEVLAFLRRCFADIWVTDGYGSTEVGTITVDGRIQPGVEVKLIATPELDAAPDEGVERGEIWVRTPHTVSGYLEDAASEASFDAEGFFRTGDLGERDADGSVRVVGRLNSAVKLAQGEFVVPERIEAALAGIPLVDQLHVRASPGAGRVAALVVPHLEPLARALGRQSATLSEACRDERAPGIVLEALVAEARRARLLAFETPAAVLLEPAPLSVARGLATPSGKLARAAIARAFGAQLDALPGVHATAAADAPGRGSAAADEPRARDHPDGAPRHRSAAADEPRARDHPDGAPRPRTGAQRESPSDGSLLARAVRIAERAAWRAVDPDAELSASLGGDSLAAAEFMALLGEELGRELSLSNWFEARTLRDLVARLAPPAAPPATWDAHPTHDAAAASAAASAAATSSAAATWDGQAAAATWDGQAAQATCAHATCADTTWVTRAHDAPLVAIVDEDLRTPWDAAVAQNAERATLDARAPAAGVPPPRAVLLTGATGFLGTHLVESLLARAGVRLLCPVRARSDAAAEARLDERLASYEVPLDPTARARVTAFAADLAQPGLGLAASTHQRLAAEVDAIVHAGATVSWLARYSELRAPNLGGTRELLALAVANRPKPFHHVSTISTAPADGDESCLLDRTHALASSGYVLSKWVSERAVRQAAETGLEVTIHRPGMIAGHSRRGAGNPDDYPNRYLRACANLGVYLDLVDERLDLTPVDYVAEAIAALVFDKGAVGRTYHLCNFSQSLTYREIGRALVAANLECTPLPYGAFRAALLEHSQIASPLRALAGYFPERGFALRMGPWPNERTRSALEQRGIRCPPSDGRLVATYVRALERRGLLSARARAPSPDARLG